MRIVVIGGTVLIGSKTVACCAPADHEDRSRQLSILRIALRRRQNLVPGELLNRSRRRSLHRQVDSLPNSI